MNLFSKLGSLLCYSWIALLPTQLSWHYWSTSQSLSGIRVDYLAYSFVLSEVIFLNWFLLSVFDFSKNALLTEKSRFLKTFPWLLVSYLLLLTLWSTFPGVHLIAVIKWTIALASLWLLKPKWDKGVLTKIFSIQLLVVLGIASLQIINQSAGNFFTYWLGERQFSITTPGIATFNLNGNLYLRPYAIFSHPNVLAGYSLIIFFWLLLKGQVKNFTEKLLWWSGVLSACVLVFLSFSQTAWAVFLVGGVLFSFFKLKKPDFLAKRMTLIYCILLIFGFLFPFLLSFSLVEMESVQLRNHLWQSWLGFISGVDLWGKGWHGFLAYLYEQPQVWAFRQVLQPFHHSWLYWLGSGGVFLICLVVYYCWRFKNHLRNFLKTEYGFLFSLIFLLGITDHYWVTQPQTFWLMAFLLLDYFSENA